MKLLATSVTILLLFLALTGCSKKNAAVPDAPATPPAAAGDSQAETPPAQTSTPRPPKSSKAAPAAAEAVNQPLVGSVHAFMTAQLRIFIQQNGRLPKDFSEFANARMDSVPRAPEGLKYAIDAATQEVKLVRK